MDIADIIRAKNLTSGNLQEILSSMKVGDIIRQFPEMAPLIRGEFTDDPLNVYDKQPSGLIVSRKVDRGIQEIRPTIGIMISGIYNFPTDNNTETLMVIGIGRGGLIAGVNNGPKSVLERYGTITAPAGTTLNMEMHMGNGVYFCTYTPKVQTNIGQR